MMEKDFVPNQNLEYLEEGAVGWKAPSNIALVKYWGKMPHQIPANPSISFTLDACASRTFVTYKRQRAKAPIPLAEEAIPLLCGKVLELSILKW